MCVCLCGDRDPIARAVVRRAHESGRALALSMSVEPFTRRNATNEWRMRAGRICRRLAAEFSNENKWQMRLHLEQLDIGYTILALICNYERNNDDVKHYTTKWDRLIYYHSIIAEHFEDNCSFKKYFELWCSKVWKLETACTFRLSIWNRNGELTKLTKQSKTAIAWWWSDNRYADTDPTRLPPAHNNAYWTMRFLANITSRDVLQLLQLNWLHLLSVCHGVTYSHIWKHTHSSPDILPAADVFFAQSVYDRPLWRFIHIVLIVFLA